MVVELVRTLSNKAVEKIVRPSTDREKILTEKTAYQTLRIAYLEHKIKTLEERNEQLEEDLLKAKQANPLFVIGDYFQRTTVQRRTLGTAKFKITKLISVETIWLISFGALAEVIANIFIPIIVEVTPLGAFLSLLLPLQVDAVLTMLNISGAFMEGMLMYCEKNYVRFLNPPLIAVCRGGYISTYTSLVGLVEHGSELAPRPYAGAVYMLVVLLVGIAANLAGMHFCRLILWVKRGGKNNMDRGVVKVIDLSATIWDDLIFNLVYLFIFAAGFLCFQNTFTYEVEDFLSGIAWVTFAVLVGSTIEGSALHDGIQWGTFRCNITACVLMAGSFVAGKYYPGIKGMSVFRKFIASGCGAISAFAGTTSDTIELWRCDRRSTAVWNVLVNAAMMTCIMYPLASLRTEEERLEALLNAPDKTSVLHRFAKAWWRKSEL
mmetsp:Transcript_14005/g.34215  ORF Transcript_14005/g.34215 Transcript_14005/m.34215 type:complete len:435 (-) Transcript_14005:476-1780(-)